MNSTLGWVTTLLLAAVGFGSTAGLASKSASWIVPVVDVYARNLGEGVSAPAQPTGEGIAVNARRPVELVVSVRSRLHTDLDVLQSCSGVQVVADRDLGSPAAGGVRAGADLAPIMTRTLVDDGVVLSLVIEPKSALMPRAGLLSLTVRLGGWMGIRCQPRTTKMQIFDILSLRTDIAPILTTRCYPCHSPSLKFENLDLSVNGVLTTAVNVRAHETPDGSCAELRMAPCAPDASYVINKIEGTHLGGCVNGGGDRMPAGGPYLSNAQTQLIRDWIAQGCRNN